MHRESVGMEELKQRIRAEGQNLGSGILKIDSILNHQIDTGLMMRCGAEIAKRFVGKGITRIVTAEVSGIAPAFAAGFALQVPVVYARKVKPVTMYGPVYLETAPSHTKGVDTNLLISAEFLPPGEHVLVIDDFLASGRTLRSLVRMVESAKCHVIGIAAVVEKVFEGGRDLLVAHYQFPIEALVTITNMDNGEIVFAE
jgi:xanthine phosphoribosyltransferase